MVLILILLTVFTIINCLDQGPPVLVLFVLLLYSCLLLKVVSGKSLVQHKWIKEKGYYRLIGFLLSLGGVFLVFPFQKITGLIDLQKFDGHSMIVFSVFGPVLYFLLKDDAPC